MEQTSFMASKFEKSSQNKDLQSEFKILHSIIYLLERKDRKSLRDENIKVMFH